MPCWHGLSTTVSIPEEQLPQCRHSKNEQPQNHKLLNQHICSENDSLKLTTGHGGTVTSCFDSSHWSGGSILSHSAKENNITYTDNFPHKLLFHNFLHKNRAAGFWALIKYTISASYTHKSLSEIGQLMHNKNYTGHSSPLTCTAPVMGLPIEEAIGTRAFMTQ